MPLIGSTSIMIVGAKLTAVPKMRRGVPLLLLHAVPMLSVSPRLGSLVLVLLASLLCFFNFFFAEFISESHFYHPVIVYHIIANRYTALLRIGMSLQRKAACRSENLHAAF